MLPCSACILLLPLPHVSLLVVLVTERVRTFFFFFFRSEDEEDLRKAVEKVGLGEFASFCCSLRIVKEDELTDRRSSFGWSSSSSMSWSCWVCNKVWGGQLPSSVGHTISFVSTPFDAVSAVMRQPSFSELSFGSAVWPGCAACCAQQQLTRHDTDPTPIFVQQLANKKLDITFYWLLSWKYILHTLLCKKNCFVTWLIKFGFY